MSGIEFEKYLAEVMRSQGYSNVSLTEYYDWGVDIIAEKDNIRWGIQAKRYKNTVGVSAIQQITTGLKKYNCTKAIVITNSTYTRQAKELAKTNDCILIDKDTLADWIISFQNDQNKLA